MDRLLVQLPGRPLALNNGQLSNLVRTSNGYGTLNLAVKLNDITQELFHRQVVSCSHLIDVTIGSMSTNRSSTFGYLQPESGVRHN